MQQRSYRLGDIAAYLNAELRGDASSLITGISTLKSAGPGDLAFLSNSKYESQLLSTQAQAVILHADQAESFKGNCLVLEDVYLAYAQISSWFDSAPALQEQIYSSAVIHSTARIAEGVFIGPNVVIEANATIGRGSQIEANSVVGADSSVGQDCKIKANVTIYHGVNIGHRVIIHSGAVVGADGFGFAPDSNSGWQKINQVGGVLIGNDVEIGACSTVDRGAIEDTVVGNGVIIDNHVQIAHNAKVGDNTAMAAYSGLAGSASVGKNCLLAGCAHVVGHVSICDNVQLPAHTLITKDITEAGSYSSASTPLMSTGLWRKNAVRVGQLNDMALRIKELEKSAKKST